VFVNIAIYLLIIIIVNFSKMFEIFYKYYNS
jgi:hypothetical protein